MSQKFNISKKNLFEVKSRIEQMKKHPNLTLDDLAYMEAIAETYFRFAPGNQVSFEFGFIEGYFKALHTYATPVQDESKKIIDPNDLSKASS